MEVNLKRVSAMVGSEKITYDQQKIFYSEGTKNEETNSPSTLNGIVIIYNNMLTIT
jgi:hypothetical protein